MTTLGNNIKASRRQLHITQGRLGQMVNRSGQAISSYENGHSIPNQNILEHMASIFHLTPSQLIGTDNLPADRQKAVDDIQYVEQEKEAKKNLNKPNLNKIAIEISLIENMLNDIKQELAKGEE